jgi:hypothetical protein
VSDFTEALDVFFNERPAANFKELQRLRAENLAMRDLIKLTHKDLTPDCRCWVCFQPSASDKP